MPWCFHSKDYWEKETQIEEINSLCKSAIMCSPKQHLDFEKYSVLKYFFTQVVQNFRQRQKKKKIAF